MKTNKESTVLAKTTGTTETDNAQKTKMINKRNIIMDTITKSKNGAALPARPDEKSEEDEDLRLDVTRTTSQRLIVGNCRRMLEIEDKSIDLVVTSPPYYNAPHDYRSMFSDYDDYLSLIKDLANELKRVLREGRAAVINTDDMRIDYLLYPIVSDTIQIFLHAGFCYQENIIWQKPSGYTMRQRRSGVLRQYPYPGYWYPDNQTETILVFRNGEKRIRCADAAIREESQLDLGDYPKWSRNVWKITNVLPGQQPGIAAFPAEIAERLIKIYSYVGETVLDPFAGSGTTLKAAAELMRHSIGIELNPECVPVIKNRTRDLEVVERDTIPRMVPALAEEAAS